MDNTSVSVVCYNGNKDGTMRYCEGWFKMRILIAEDERSLAKVLAKLLKKNNHSADAVYNGEDALSYLEGGNYDVAIFDIMMPKMDGITALKKLRVSGSQIPVLMLTAKSEVDDMVLGVKPSTNFVYSLTRSSN